MLDLFAVGETNADTIQAAFESMLTGMSSVESDLIREFALWVEAEALISINVNLFVVVELLNGGRYQNIHEWAEEQSQLSGRSAEDVLRERLHKYYDRRMTFDHAFSGGERFAYGALNAGGTGPPQYNDTNPYCIVLTRAFLSSLSDVVYLPGDSLDICFRTGSFDANILRDCASPHSHRHILAAKECASETLPADKRVWQNILITPIRYFEAVFIGTIVLGEVSCVRVLKGEHERMWNMAFGNFGRKLDAAERALINDFVQLRRAVKDGRLQEEVIE